MLTLVESRLVYGCALHRCFAVPRIVPDHRMAVQRRGLAPLGSLFRCLSQRLRKVSVCLVLGQHPLCVEEASIHGDCRSHYFSIGLGVLVEQGYDSLI